jgi:hypothetical protein
LHRRSCNDGHHVQTRQLRSQTHGGYPRVVLKDAAFAAKLEKRTLTNLYNERSTWLDLAHKKFDGAVFAAYGWKSDLTDDQILAELLALNLKRAAKEAK